MSDDPGFLNPHGRATLGAIPEPEATIYDPDPSHDMQGETADDPQRCATCGADDTMPIVEAACCTSKTRAATLRRGPTSSWVEAADVPELFAASWREAMQHPRMPSTAPSLTEHVCEWIELNRQLGQRP